MENSFNLDDKTIAQIAKCVQVAILTGTDVVDHLRQLQLDVDVNNSQITVTDEYLSVFNNNIEKMLQEAAEKVEEANKQNQPEQLSLFE
jgi:hypothetical protein